MDEYSNQGVSKKNWFCAEKDRLSKFLLWRDWWRNNLCGKEMIRQKPIFRQQMTTFADRNSKSKTLILDVFRASYENWAWGKLRLQLLRFYYSKSKILILDVIRAKNIDTSASGCENSHSCSGLTSFSFGPYSFSSFYPKLLKSKFEYLASKIEYLLIDVKLWFWAFFAPKLILLESKSKLHSGNSSE